MHKRTLYILSTIFLLLTAVSPVAASEGVNLPGWVGGLLTILALGLALGTSVWLRSR